MYQDKLFHDWLTNHLKENFSRDYSEIMVNCEEEKKYAFEGLYPDLILISHGLVVAVVEVETEKSITAEKAKHWKALSKLGVKLILMVPEMRRKKVMSLLWDEGIAQDVSIGTYHLKITMP
jgi:hypothetical protein